MNNQHTDINVGYQTLTNFQLMPKRFMVWDQRRQKFIDGEPLTIDDIVCSNSIRERIGELDFIQSTNLFDKDDEEIFEGSIVRDFDGEIGVVYYDSQEGQYWAKFSNGDSTAMDSPGIMKVLGHILSNLELLEEK